MPVQIHDNNAIPFGFEPEFSGSVTPTSLAAQYRSDNIEGWKTCADCGVVNAEANSPILVDCAFAWAATEDMFNSSMRAGATVPHTAQSRGGCGCHVHMSTRPLLNVKTEREREMFCRESIAHTARTGHYITQDRPELLADPITTEQLRDIILRMYDQQSIINSLHPQSRTEGRPNFSQFMGHQMTERHASRVRRATDTRGIVTAMTETHGKFMNINLSNFTSGKQTIEFRQAAGTTETVKIQKWVQLLLNIAAQTIDTRIPVPTTTTVTQTTPERGADAFGPQGHRIRNIYDMARTAAGVTTQEIMLATGISEVSVRRTITEIRNRIGNAGCETITSLSQGHSQGDGTDLTGYRVLETFNHTTTSAPTGDLTNPSIWAGTTDEDYDYWFDRIDALARR